jgi:hypothetical protein
MASPIRLGPRRVPISKVGQKHWFPWNHLDQGTWPGRELLWLWCHPCLACLMTCGFVAFIWLLVTG